MKISGTFQDLSTKLKSFQAQQNQLEAQIKETPRTSRGAVNLGFYQLTRQKNEIQSNILKINSILKPDIIA
jgi:hypothetical protein